MELNEECKKDVCVEIKLDDTSEVDELDVDVILEVLKEEIGIDTSRILIGWDTDESGRIIRVKIYVDDEATANSISSAQSKGLLVHQSCTRACSLCCWPVVRSPFVTLCGVFSI